VCVSFKRLSAPSLNKGIFIIDPFFGSQIDLPFERKFQQDCHNIEGSQCGYSPSAEQFIVFYPFTVKIICFSKKEVMPSSIHTKHCHLYLIIIAVSALQLNATILNVQAVAFVGDNGVTHSKLSVAIRFLNSTIPLHGEASGSLTQPSGVATSHG